MSVSSNMPLEQQLFQALFFAPTEDAIDTVFLQYPQIFQTDQNWYPLGGNDSNFGVIENQQSSPIAALIEKITNSIDAILMKKCYEADIDPKSPKTPRSVEEGVERFFPQWKNWDLSPFRKVQAEEIQILADGPKLNTSLIIYDNGEGQHPDEFESTFLSLLRGNKNEIHFVQGKYNMGGTGAIVFCGKKRYHLIGSRRFDGTGKFGFTLIRKHPLSKQEQLTKKNTWYEYLKINKQIPAFGITELDLGLYNRKFKTGTVIKLYSYDLPAGARSVISKDLNQSINEYLFVPALPIYTIDKEERYPRDRALQRHLYGLKRRLEQDESKYIEDFFSESSQDVRIGGMKVTCYVFKPKIEDKSIKESRETIRSEFFKNDMSVLFSVNGQVHAHYTSEFITRSLQFPLLKNHLLIHVDCTNMHLEFRNELFMASRDRLKGGDEARYLREKLANVLKQSKLKEINKHRKEAITVEGGEAQDLLKSLTKNLPLNEDLLKLLNQTFKLEEKKKEPPKTQEKKPEKEKEEREPFVGKRFPSYLRLTKHGDETKPVAQIPLGGDRTIRFLTDVENQYFDRVEDPGEFEVALLNIKRNEVTGGNKAGTPREISEVFNVVQTSPNNGVLKVVLNPTDTVQVGDAVEIKASLAGAGETFEEIFWVKISEPEQKPEPKKEKEIEDDRIGLPKHILVYKEAKENAKNVTTWEKIGEVIEMDWKTVMHPHIEGETLESIYINMDSTVLKNYKSRLKSEEQYRLADKRYISTVYFHTLFLYSINKNRQYTMKRIEGEEEKEVDLTEYLKDVFESYYSAFLLNFEISELMENLEL